MKKLLAAIIVPLIFAKCQNSKTPTITADSLRIYTLQNQKELDNDINQLNEVYKQQIDLAEHSNDDSIRYYEGKLELARAAGLNAYVQFDIRKKINEFKVDAAKKGYAIASKQAKREMDIVWATKFRVQKEKELFNLQEKLNKKEISESEFNDQVSKVKSRLDKSPITEENALKMSLEYEKERVADALNSEQKLLEAKIDSESKK
jgi:hypothetical protein